MITVQQALKILDNNIPPGRRVLVPLEQAHGCCLYEDVMAAESSPRFTNSAMDGFAVRWADCVGGTTGQPVSLRMIGESQAGIPFDGIVEPGTTVRVSTGAMLPTGADTVVRHEDTHAADGQVEIVSVGPLGTDVRKQGEEFQIGDLLLAARTRLGSRELALLAAFGVGSVPIFSPPRVALVITGTELARPEEKGIKDYQIRDSNGIMLASAVKEAGGVLSSITHVRDSLAETVDAIGHAAAAGDEVILCSGGVSVGHHDHVKAGAQQAGFVELFWKIRQKPGKPLFAGRRNDTLLFGLPGNPVSAFMCFSNYVRPVLASLQGTATVRRSVTARSFQRVANNGKRTNFIRVVVEDRPNEMAVIKEMERQGSHMLSSIVHADGYIVLDPGTVLEAGDLIDVILF